MRRLFFATTFLVLILGAAESSSASPADPSVSRADAVVAILLARQVPVYPLTQAPRYSDIPLQAWYAPYMVVAADRGIISTDPKTAELKPMQSINRAEFLKMLSIAFSLSTTGTTTYKDVPEDSAYAPYATIAFRYRIFGDGTFLEPLRLITPEDVRRAVTLIRQKAVTQAVNPTPDEPLRVQLRRERRVAMRQQVLSTKEQAPLTKPTADDTLEKLRNEILIIVNLERARKGLSALSAHPQLETSAQTYAEKMAVEGFFGHVSPDGEVLRDRIADAGYYDRSYSATCQCVKGYTLGENLARGYSSPREVVDAWMASESHREAILNGIYQDTGIGIASGIWVQHFGKILLPQ